MYQRITHGKYCERCRFCNGKQGNVSYFCYGLDRDMDVCAYGDKGYFRNEFIINFVEGEKEVEE